MPIMMGNGVPEARKINLNSPYFKNMLEELDMRIQEAMTLMDVKCLGNAKITLNIDILQERRSLERNGRCRDAVLPTIKYSTGMKLDMKDSSTGYAIFGDRELKKAEDGSYYVITIEEGDGQIGIDDIVWEDE